MMHHCSRLFHTYEPVSKAEEGEPLPINYGNGDDDVNDQRAKILQRQLRCCGRCCRRCFCCLATTASLYVMLVVSVLLYEMRSFHRSPESFMSEHSGGGNPTGVIGFVLKRAGYRTDAPLWMQKNLAIAMPKSEKEICFVHVGKTAGSTLACYFGFLYSECAASHTANGTVVEAMPVAPGLLPASTTHAVHTSYNDCRDRHFDYYLFVLRDPLKRIQSWFNYELPVNGRWSGQRLYAQQRLFTDCNFHTLNELGEIGLMPRDGNSSNNTNNATTDDDSASATTEVCQARAHMAITGAVGYSTHNYYNFGYYLRNVNEKAHMNATDLLSSQKIAVIRTEHLAADWRSMEEDLLHGPRDLHLNFTRKRNASPPRPEVTYLSPTAQQRICAALCEEIQVYKSLLHAAVNLHDVDVADSMAELGESCPVEAAAPACH